MPGTVLIIDDEEGLRKLLGRIVSLEHFTVHEAGTLKEARSVLQRMPVDVVLCDVRLPDGNGVDFIKEVKTSYPLLEGILLTAYGNISDGVQAIKNGAFDYLTKGNDNDRLVPLLYQAFDKVTSNRKNAVTVKATGSSSFEDIIGQSAPIVEAKRLGEKIAGSDTTLLLLGETGTGKEVFANAVHNKSKRGSGPFVAINCSAFSKELLEGELFGHKAGAYTGAVKDKKGLFEVADQGTIFLDEAGEMDLDLQARLLRVLENGTFIKLGDTKTTQVNVRIIAATNRDLQKEVKEGRFRSDLFYRLNVFPIVLPPLRERADDVPLFVDHFIKVFTAKESKGPVTVDKQTIHLLKAYSWPGNIRELKNIIERAVILLDDHTLLPLHLPYELQKGNNTTSGLSLAEVEKAHIQKVLSYTKGHKTRTAELLGIGLTTLYRKMEEYGIGLTQSNRG